MKEFVHRIILKQTTAKVFSGRSLRKFEKCGHLRCEHLRKSQQANFPSLLKSEYYSIKYSLNISGIVNSEVVKLYFK